MCPTALGGKNWPSGTYSPLGNVMFFPLQNTCATVVADAEPAEPGLALRHQDRSAYRAGRHERRQHLCDLGGDRQDAVEARSTRRRVVARLDGGRPDLRRRHQRAVPRARSSDGRGAVGSEPRLAGLGLSRSASPSAASSTSRSARARRSPRWASTASRPSSRPASATRCSSSLFLDGSSAAPCPPRIAVGEKALARRRETVANSATHEELRNVQSRAEPAFRKSSRSTAAVSPSHGALRHRRHRDHDHDRGSGLRHDRERVHGGLARADAVRHLDQPLGADARAPHALGAIRRLVLERVAAAPVRAFRRAASSTSFGPEFTFLGTTPVLTRAIASLAARW